MVASKEQIDTFFRNYLDVETFERAYCLRHKITAKEYAKEKITCHCDCGRNCCLGWVALGKV